MRFANGITVLYQKYKIFSTFFLNLADDTSPILKPKSFA